MGSAAISVRGTMMSLTVWSPKVSARRMRVCSTSSMWPTSWLASRIMRSSSSEWARSRSEAGLMWNSLRTPAAEMYMSQVMGRVIR